MLLINNNYVGMGRVRVRVGVGFRVLVVLLPTEEDMPSASRLAPGGASPGLTSLRAPPSFWSSLRVRLRLRRPHLVRARVRVRVRVRVSCC